MFKTNKMYGTLTIVPSSKLNEIINDFYETGVCQIKKTEQLGSDAHFIEHLKEFDDLQIRLTQVEKGLTKYKKAKKESLLKPQKPKRSKTSIKSFKSLKDESSEFLSTVGEKVLNSVLKIKLAKEQISNNHNLIRTLRKLPELNTSSLKSTENIKLYVGTTTPDKIEEHKSELQKNLVALIKEYEKGKVTIVAAASHDVDKILEKIEFTKITLPEFEKDISVGKKILELRRENHKFKNEISDEAKKLVELYKKHYKKVEILLEETSIEREKLVAMHDLSISRTFTIIETWVPAKNIEKYTGIIENHTTDYYLEYDEKKDAPTQLNNPKIINSFEMITELYSLPKYGRWDPTSIVAFSLPLFFGFMLTDVVYGILLLIIGLLLAFKIGKYDEGMRKTGTLLTVFGIFTVVMGVIFTSYLGNFFQEIGVNIPVIIDPMKQVMLALSIAIGLGVLHLLVGLIFGFIENVKLGKTKDAISTQGIWLIFVVGVGLIFVQKYLGLGVIGLSVALEMYFKFQEGGLMPSILSIFGFSGFLGDVFSYARLMALGVGTAGIALAVNFMTLMVVDMIPYVGILLAIVIFIVGHLFNMFMNGLGSFIHSIRLHFLELFQKFYDGGGMKYSPFKVKRVKTVLE